jgi:hypothetical protein
MSAPSAAPNGAEGASAVQGSPAPKEGTPAAPPKKRRWPRSLVTVLVALAVIIVGVVIFAEPILRFLVKREALARGVELDFETMSIGRGWMRLRKARLSLTGVSGINVELGKTTISWDGIFPSDIARIEGQAIAVRAEGSVADRALEISAWAKDHPDAFRIPIAAADILVEWRDRAGAAPWMTLSGGSLSPTPSGVTYLAQAASIDGIAIGPAGGIWTASGGVISLGFGRPSLADAPVRIDVNTKANPPTADIVLRPVTMADLGSPLGLRLPTEKATLEGAAKIALPERAGTGAAQGTFSMTLRGWIPPHPRELGGIVFGDRTNFASSFRVSEDRRTVTLTDTTVVAGAFKLKGSGLIERKADYATVKMNMAGAVLCVDIARSAAGAHFGDAAGALAGTVARGLMEGSVAVSVRVEADTRDIGHPKIEQGVGVGCGLKGLPQIRLPLPDIKLPSPEDFPKLPDFGL